MISSPTLSTTSLASSSESAGYPDYVVILYASETGNAQDTAERVAREFRRLGRRCVTTSMDMFDILDLPHIPLLVLITSTHGRGDPPPAMLPLWTALLRTSLPENILEDVNFALFGLGDTSYEKFCFAGKMLARRLEGLGASKMGEPAWGDERAPDGIEEAFLPWLKQTVDLMVPHLPPISDDFEVQPSTSLPPPIFAFDYVSPSFDSLRVSEEADSHDQVAPSRAADEMDGVGSSSMKPDDWMWSRLTRNKRVTKDGWWQDVREIELEIEDEKFAGYAPGSICNIQPRSSPTEVDEFLEAMDLQSEADRPFTIRSTLPDQPLPAHLPSSETNTTLRRLLSDHLDIRCSPRKSFFEWLRRLSTDEREQERLDEFIADPDEIHEYATRPSRSILETLHDFRETRIPPSHILEILPPLRRRQFSIASSWDAHLGKVQLLIALVEYKTILSIPRRGLCSSWLDRLEEGTRLPLKISPPTLHLPADPSTPTIFVGPGTGVAPMRAFVEERVNQGAAEKTILYFGCRSASSDLYYRDEWATYRQKGVRIEVAASRDQEEKIYVQHLIKRDAAMIRDWVVKQNGHIYISGSSNAMPREVREAIAWCLTQGSDGKSEEEAKAYVDEMFENGRGGEESW